MTSIVILAVLLLVNAAAGLRYPPLFANAAAIAVLIGVAWRELRSGPPAAGGSSGG